MNINYKLYQTQGFCGGQIQGGIALAIVLAAYAALEAVSYVAINKFSENFPSAYEQLKHRVEEWSLPGHLAAVALINALAYKIYHHSSSWMGKTIALILQLTTVMPP